MKLIKGQLYCIWWRDTSEIEEMAIKCEDYIRSIGFYIGTFGQFTVIAAGYNTNPSMADWGLIQYIPTNTIKKTKKMK